MNHRTLIGISLAGVVLICLYFGWVGILYIGINLAVGYDVIYMQYKQQTNLFITSIFFLVMELHNYLLLQFYYRNAHLLIKIITIAQVSDVYQYLAGTRLGRNKIGWISKNKTYEGYVIGWLLTMATYESILWIQFLTGHIKTLNMSKGFYDVSMIYLLSVVSGLCSSLFKRMIDIKDYSDLLGPHGGWIDRIDSIILPSIAYL